MKSSEGINGVIVALTEEGTERAAAVNAMLEAECHGSTSRARNLWYFGSKCYHVFSFATGILMW